MILVIHNLSVNFYIMKLMNIESKKDFRKNLRNNATTSEKRLWKFLNKKQQIFKFRRLPVSAQLELKYGRNFAEKNLRRMIQFSIEFSDFEIVFPLARQLTWSHFLLLIPLKSKESKYIMCLIPLSMV